MHGNTFVFSTKLLSVEPNIQTVHDWIQSWEIFTTLQDKVLKDPNQQRFQNLNDSIFWSFLQSIRHARFIHFRWEESSVLHMKWAQIQFSHNNHAWYFLYTNRRHFYGRWESRNGQTGIQGCWKRETQRDRVHSLRDISSHLLWTVIIRYLDLGSLVHRKG